MIYHKMICYKTKRLGWTGMSHARVIREVGRRYMRMCLNFSDDRVIKLPILKKWMGDPPLFCNSLSGNLDGVIFTLIAWRLSKEIERFVGRPHPFHENTYRSLERRDWEDPPFAFFDGGKLYVTKNYEKIKILRKIGEAL